MDSVTCAFHIGNRPCAFCGNTGYIAKFWAAAPLIDYQLSRCSVCGAIRVTTNVLGREHICSTCAANIADATLTRAVMDRAVSA